MSLECEVLLDHAVLENQLLNIAKTRARQHFLKLQNKDYILIISTTVKKRKHYPTDISDEKWCFVAPYPMLIDGNTHQRKRELREIFNAVHWTW